MINELHLNKELAGTLMGTAAGLEIPVMILRAISPNISVKSA